MYKYLIEHGDCLSICLDSCLVLERTGTGEERGLGPADILIFEGKGQFGSSK